MDSTCISQTLHSEGKQPVNQDPCDGLQGVITRTSGRYSRLIVVQIAIFCLLFAAMRLARLVTWSAGPGGLLGLYKIARGCLYIHP